jgi:hypothetical protein
VNEEPGRLDIQWFRNVFADLDQVLTALPALAGRRFVSVFDTGEMLGSGLTAGADPGRTPRRRIDLVGHPFQFRLDGRWVDRHGFGEQVALTLDQGFALLAKPEPLVVGQFEGRGLDFELGGVERRLAAGERLLGQGQFGAELFHLAATVQRRHQHRARTRQQGVR